MARFELAASPIPMEWSDLTDVHPVVRVGRFERPTSRFRGEDSTWLSYTLWSRWSELN